MKIITDNWPDDTYQFVTDSQEIEWILDYLPINQTRKNSLKSEIGLIYVQVIESDYGKVYYSSHSVPWIGIELYPLRYSIEWIRLGHLNSKNKPRDNKGKFMKQ